MSGFAAIDLSRLPAPDIVEVLDAEAIIASIKADVISRSPELTSVLALESEPVVKLIEAVAYREILLRARVNDAARAVLLATASGADLDNLAALFGVVRLLVAPADLSQIPPVAALYETDTALRRRTQLALEGYSVAGPRGAYMFHALTAHASIKDVSVSSPAPGDVLVVLLTSAGVGTASAEVIAAAATALNADDVRPLCDTVNVQSATVVTFTVAAVLEMSGGPDGSVVLAAAQAALTAYLASTHMVGVPVRLSGLYAALHQPGVSRVILSAPLADIVPSLTQAAFCTAASVVLA